MKIYTAIMLLPAFILPATAGDIENGDDLHFENCTGCHQESIYTSSNRNVKSMKRLGLQVRFCKDTLELTWFDEDVDDVVEFLDQQYYHF
ncbi:MAG: cytochrome c [Gammaproteobacteria bacterium]|nr:cytochrome c [Gammaproteobacteria bacterium]